MPLDPSLLLLPGLMPVLLPSLTPISILLLINLNLNLTLLGCKPVGDGIEPSR